MKNYSPFPYRLNEAIFFVESYCDGEVAGQLIHPRAEQPVKIKGMTRLLFSLDEMLTDDDKLIFDRAFAADALEKIHRIATLRIQILFREHNTWQGCILWEEEGKEVAFRSALDMIRLLDEILA